MGGLPHTPVHAICDADVAGVNGWTVEQLAAALIRGGARLIQLRAKNATSRWLYEHSVRLLQLAKPSETTIIVNDRADVAALAGAHGVHVGQDDLAPAQIRTILGNAAIVGRSTHTDDQAIAAAAEPISYLAIGPVFASTSKITGDSPVGLRGVERAAAIAGRAGVPLVAIGGITLDRAADVRAAGAAAVAVIGDLLVAGDPERRMRAYLESLATQ